MSHSKLEGLLDLYLVRKAPSLPKGFKELIVWIAPWLVLALAVNSFGVILLVFSFGSVESSSMVTGYGQAYYLLIILSLAVAMMYIFAFPEVFRRNKLGWNLVFYASLLNFLFALIVHITSSTDTGFLILEVSIKTLLSLYLLFQIKVYYK